MRNLILDTLTLRYLSYQHLSYGEFQIFFSIVIQHTIAHHISKSTLGESISCERMNISPPQLLYFRGIKQAVFIKLLRAIIPRQL